MYIIISTTIASTALIIGIKLIVSYLHNQLLINHVDHYHKLFIYYMQLSYDTIWKDQIIAFTSNGVHPPKDQLETSARNYGKYAIQLMGPAIHKSLVFYFGSEECLWVNIIADFNSRVDSEELENHVKKIQTGKITNG